MKQTSYNSLINSADLLPHTQLFKPKQILGRNTEDAIKVGMYFSYIEAVNGIIKKIRKEYKVKFKTIITGGFAKMIYDEIISIGIYEPNLTLKGLKILYDLNELGKNAKN